MSNRQKLSPIEDRVFALIAAGWNIKQIADEIGLALGSVAQVSHRIKKKLRVTSAVQIALAWHGCDLAAARAFADELGRAA